MKYRHAYHAGNFADVHKHVTLLTLLGALQRKDKGFLYLDTHAGRGVYDLSTPAAESAAGIGRFQQGVISAPELQQYAEALSAFRAMPGNAHCYPGSPLLAARALRPQDRAVCVELLGAEANALTQALAASGGEAGGDDGRVRIERGDGFALLRAQLPPAQRRGLTFIDPPYEERNDFERVTAAVADGLRRFPSGVFAAWYPIKDARDASAWHAAYAAAVTAPTLVSELWLYPRDSRVALNGSGLLITNPPYLIGERMQVWLPELQSRLAVEAGAGSLVRML
ncbi:MAG: 23S rRNA (adenine(2030)-N(6))-methyltransferase RlmJ [Steroidobacterales bacterium]|jgi:23S rRNA (adenine2030-N6)-methyltransferase